MRRLAVLALIAFAIAAPAAAGPNSKITVIKQPPAASADKAAGLRGVLPATAKASGGAESASPIPAPLAQAWSAPIPQASGNDAIQCRTGCAQTYYFCNAGGDEDCPARWSQCAASCTASATYQPYQPAS